MSNYEPEENESGEREFHDAWASVMAGAAGPSAERPTADAVIDRLIDKPSIQASLKQAMVDAARDKDDVAGVTVTCKTGTKPTPRELWLGAFGPVEESRRSLFDWCKPQRPPLANPEDAANMDTPPSRNQGPSHYTGLDIQPWEAMESWMTKDEFAGFLRGNAIKYLARAPHKGGVEDYRKAKHYLEKLLSLLAES